MPTAREFGAGHPLLALRLDFPQDHGPRPRSDDDDGLIHSKDHPGGTDLG
jgi:hypothetical protein